MSIEIERKFLPSEVFDLSLFKKKSHIQQGFLCADQERVVRVRVKEEKGYLTIKGPSDSSGLSRFEFEQEISVTKANEILQFCYKPLIEKIRFNYLFEGHIFEVDVFQGENQGLIIIELELENKLESVRLPPFVGQEVTGVPQFYNAYLAKYPVSSWSRDLKKKFSIIF